MSSYVATADDPPFGRLGGEAAVNALAERFYDLMEAHEPELTQLHHQDEPGKVSRGSRDRFALFLVGWLGGPQDYTARHGHPRLRMRHANVKVDTKMRDAWMRTMKRAMEDEAVPPDVRQYLEGRFLEVADFMRNAPG